MVQNGTPANYYLSADGKRIEGGAQVPQAAVECARTKEGAEPGSAAVVLQPPKVYGDPGARRG